jgi:hypothetical protein
MAGASRAPPRPGHANPFTMPGIPSLGRDRSETNLSNIFISQPKQPVRRATRAEHQIDQSDEQTGFCAGWCGCWRLSWLGPPGGEYRAVPQSAVKI